ncbi:MAG: glycosyltransferase [Planctomycetota bacterium]
MTSIRRVLVAGIWDEGPGYPRTDSLIQAIQSAGIEVRCCRVDPPKLGGSKTSLIAKPWRWPGYLWRSRAVKAELRAAVKTELRDFEPDLVLVPYPGHLAVRWIRSLCTQPIWLDLFLSAWSTTVDDRQLFSPGSPAAKALASLDRRACRAADRVLLDTRAHALDVATRTGLDPSRFGYVQISDPAAPTPVPMPQKSSGDGRDSTLRCVFFGTGVPLHGLPVWVDVMASMENVHWTVFGGDPHSRAAARDRLGDRLDLRAEFAPMDEIREAIDASHLVCGAVGTSNKAQKVVPFKVVHGMAHGRLVLTGDNSSVREMLEPGSDCLTAPPGDVERLQSALGFAASLGREELQRFGDAARRRYDNGFAIPAVRRAFERELEFAGFEVSRPEGTRAVEMNA